MAWETAANVSTTITMILAIPATAFALFQLLEMKRGSKLSAFIAAWNFLQEEHVREARRILIELKKNNIENWTQDDRDAAELALQRYNSVAILVRNSLIPDSFVLQWKHSIILCWEAARPLVKQYREERGPDYWQQLEDLYKLAVEGKTKRHGGFLLS